MSEMTREEQRRWHIEHRQCTSPCGAEEPYPLTTYQEGVLCGGCGQSRPNALYRLASHVDGELTKLTAQLTAANAELEKFQVMYRTAIDAAEKMAVKYDKANAELARLRELAKALIAAHDAMQTCFVGQAGRIRYADALAALRSAVDKLKEEKQ